MRTYSLDLLLQVIVLLRCLLRLPTGLLGVELFDCSVSTRPSNVVGSRSAVEALDARAGHREMAYPRLEFKLHVSRELPVSHLDGDGLGRFKVEEAESVGVECADRPGSGRAISKWMVAGC